MLAVGIVVLAVVSVRLDVADGQSLVGFVVVQARLFSLEPAVVRGISRMGGRWSWHEFAITALHCQ